MSFELRQMWELEDRIDELEDRISDLEKSVKERCYCYWSEEDESTTEK